MTAYVQTIDWNGEELEVHFYYTPAIEGNTWGAYENCYPSEPESWEVAQAFYKGIDVLPLLDADLVLEKLQEVEDE